MYYPALVSLIILLIPAGVFAANSTFQAGQSLLVASSSQGNAYAVGASVLFTAPVTGDLSAFGGSVVTAAPVTGDALFLGGSVNVRSAVRGDVRIVGGSVNVAEPVGGDLVAIGYSVRSDGRAKDTFIVAVDASLANGASGPVTIYANNAVLAGHFVDDVRIVASGRLSLAASTTILGKLSYQAPEAATIPPSAQIIGGVEYTNVAYLPNPNTSRALELLSIGLFLLVRVLGALLLAGLFAGLFPHLAQAIVELAYTGRAGNMLLTTLLGFAILVATPLLCILLFFTFVGIGLAFLILLAYLLLLLLGFIYAGVLVGGLLIRRFGRRETILWRDGVLGMLVLSLIAFIPVIGWLIGFLLTLFSVGALTLLFFRRAFNRDEYSDEPYAETI